MARELSIALTVIVTSCAALVVFLDTAVPEPSFAQVRVDGVSLRSSLYIAIYGGIKNCS